MSLRSFSREAPNLAEPVILTHDQQIIGTWYPLGTEPSSGVSIGKVEQRPGVNLGGYNTRPFTPVPKVKK